MSRYDVSPDEAPIDMAAVVADDQQVERLCRALSPEAAVVWDDDDDEVEPAFALLRRLQRDVSADLPDDLAGAIVPPPGATLLAARHRHRRAVAVAAVAAGVLSVGGVAAAASAPGQPLAGVRAAVSSAFTTVVDAITPDAPVGPSAAEPSHPSTPTTKPTTKPTPKPAPPGQAVSAAARSAAAARQISALLGTATHLLDRGQYTAAKQQLDSAERRLPLVTDAAAHRTLADRLDALRARLEAARPASTHGSTSSSPAAQSTQTSGPGNGNGNGNGPPASHGAKPASTHGPHPQKTAVRPAQAPGHRS